MRLALKHQIIMAPAAVLCLMTLLLCFLQLTYWDMSVKRQQTRNLKTAFIALAEADMAAQRMHGVVRFLVQAQEPDHKNFVQITNLHRHLAMAIDQLQETGLLGLSSMSLLRQSVVDLNPDQGIKLERFDATLNLLHPHITEQLDELNQRRVDLGDVHREDFDALVAETTFVAIIVLAIAILVGILLSLAFARNILRRIHVLSDSAARITNGDFSPPQTPDQVRDELDALAVSINRMTEQLIRVVAAEKLLEGAEEERRRIAMDIHDQTLADLSAVRRGLEHLRQDPSCEEAAASIETDLQRATANLRVVMDDLHPQTLDILGLPAALESFLEKSCESPGSPAYHFLGNADAADLKLPRLTQVTVYRVVVEAINNVLRHAHASQLEVGMTLRGGTLVVAVEDNGRGFDHVPRLPTASGGRGLHNIRERARAIGAQACWRNSRFSSGTRFELVLPLNQD
jgi:two-component system sensor histidine kinase UhpB